MITISMTMIFKIYPFNRINSCFLLFLVVGVDSIVVYVYYK